jgi:hypothetical protein
VAYDNLTSRTDAVPSSPRGRQRVLTKATEQSAALLFRRIPVNRAQARMPVLSALPVAYWVTGDTGQKQTTELAWQNKYLNVEEIAVILPIPNNVADDVDYDIWDEAQPLIAEAVGRTLDSAVFFGTNARPVPDRHQHRRRGGRQQQHRRQHGRERRVLRRLRRDAGAARGRRLRHDRRRGPHHRQGAFRAARATQGERLDGTASPGTSPRSTAPRSSTR